MTTHVGKIGRLSKDRREELGQRIENSQPGTEIIHWLNALPDVQEILAKYFQGRPILEQNLSDWKQSGHIVWLRRQEARESAGRMIESAEDLDQLSRAAQDRWWEAQDDLDAIPPERRLSDRYAVVLSAELQQLGMTLLAEEPDLEKRWQRLRALNRELSVLRRDDHRMAQIDLRCKQGEAALARQREEDDQRKDEERKALLSGMVIEPFSRKLQEQVLGPKRTEMLSRIKYDQPMDDLLNGTWDAKQAQAQAETEKRESKKRKSGNRSATPKDQATPKRRLKPKNMKPSPKPVAPTALSAVSPTGSRQAPAPAKRPNPTATVPSPLGLAASKRSVDGGKRARVRGPRTSQSPQSQRKTRNQNPVKTPAKSPRSSLIKPNKAKPQPSSPQSQAPTSKEPSNTKTPVLPPPILNQTPQPPPKPDPAPAITFKPEANPLAELHAVRNRMLYGTIPYDQVELDRLLKLAYQVK